MSLWFLTWVASPNFSLIPWFSSGSLWNLLAMDFPGWSCKTSFRPQILLLRSLLWASFLLKERSHVHATLCPSLQLPLLQFTLLRSCSSLASLASLLSSDKGTRPCRRVSVIMLLSCLKVPSPPYLHPFPSALHSKVTSLTPAPISFFLLYFLPKHSSGFTCVFLIDALILQSLLQ